MKSFHIPDDKKVRVILDTDVKNEVDDQFAIVHALLSESILLKGIVPAHFGTEKSSHSQKDSYEETMLLLKKMQMQNMIRVENGAPTALTDEATPIDSNGARLIIEEAMREDERPLYLAFLGPLTDSVRSADEAGNCREKSDRFMDWRTGVSDGRMGIQLEKRHMCCKCGFQILRTALAGSQKCLSHDAGLFRRTMG